jgi:hypothetical protein
MLGKAERCNSFKKNLFGALLSLNDNRINSSGEPKKLIPARRGCVLKESVNKGGDDYLLRNHLFGCTE